MMCGPLSIKRSSFTTICVLPVDACASRGTAGCLPSALTMAAAAVSCFATQSPTRRRPQSSLPRTRSNKSAPSSRQIPTASSGLEMPASISLPNDRTSASAALLGAGLAILSASAAIAFPEAAASAAELFPSLPLREPDNALSLPTWAVHVSSVVEWITAMALVWQYGDKSGYESWKGLSWGMVPLLGGAFCACTWHFFYNSESLEARQIDFVLGLLVVRRYQDWYLINISAGIKRGLVGFLTGTELMPLAFAAGGFHQIYWRQRWIATELAVMVMRCARHRKSMKSSSNDSSLPAMRKERNRGERQ
ncbi:hypothetical protein ACLOJK_033505 [Asimina triloba]